MCTTHIIDKLPAFLWMEVFQYFPLRETFKLQFIHETFKTTFLEKLRENLLKIPAKITKNINYLLYTLQNSALNRLKILKSVTLLRYVLTEFNILYSIIWRYSGIEEVWSFLAPHLIPVIEEFERLISSVTNLEMSHDDISSFYVRHIFDKHYIFLSNFDNKFEKLISQMTPLVQFETRAFDILFCCPSINFQLDLKRKIGSKREYNIRSIFKLSNLKPSYQVPDVHNSELSVDEKKTKLIKYLRECVQWENMTYLQDFVNEINTLEFRLMFMPLRVPDSGLDVISTLTEKYDAIQLSPYEPIYRQLNFSRIDSDKYFHEKYQKCSTYNENFTGLFIIIDVPNLTPNNFPFSIHSFRKVRKPFLEEENIIDSEENLNYINNSSYLTEKSYNITDYLGSIVHMTINYREGLRSTSAEAIIDVISDENNQSHVNINIIQGEAFTETTSD